MFLLAFTLLTAAAFGLSYGLYKLECKFSTLR